MAKKICGIVGSRGMVGQVLLKRMEEENDFDLITPVFFSTSQKGQKFKTFKGHEFQFQDALDLKQLAACEMIISTQGGDYTNQVYPKLRSLSWKGYWIDAASALRMKDHTLIVLDPINGESIKEYFKRGGLDFIGANCTVSLMLMAINGLVKENLVEWVSSMTYQAASGAGASHMKELLGQMKYIGDQLAQDLKNESVHALELEKKSAELMRRDQFPKANFGHPLALNLLPFIDSEWEDGQSKEEWKGGVEARKILGGDSKLIVDGTCTRIGALRSHSQGLTIKLKKDVSLIEIENLIRAGTLWTEFVKNNKEDTLKYLTPAHTSGTLNVCIGRIRKMKMGGQYLNAFTVGDQLLWGAAEPLRRVLRFICTAEF